MPETPRPWPEVKVIFRYLGYPYEIPGIADFMSKEHALLARRAVNALPAAEHLLEVLGKRHPTNLYPEEQLAIQKLAIALAEGKEPTHEHDS